MKRSIFGFLFSRGTCAELQERVSLAERSEALCREMFAREWSDRQAWERTAVSNGQHAAGLEAEAARLREDFGRRYHNLSVLYRLANEGWRAAAQLSAGWRARAVEFEREAAKGAERIKALEAQLNAGGPVS